MTRWFNIAIGYTGLGMMLFFMPGALFLIGFALLAYSIMRG